MPALISSGALVLVLARVALSHPDENLSITQVIKKYNYPVETHTYETKDGYILKAYRIPYGVTSKESHSSIIMVHGMAGSAENFINIGPPDAIGYYFADRGYDVWLFNARGNAHSRKHKKWNPDRDRKQFWDFSWHEIATIDIPATIDYILNTTGRSKLFYVGHSQGTTSFFVTLAVLPEYNEKIAAAGMLAPSAHLSYTHSPLLLLATRFLPLGQRLLPMFNWYELAIPNSPSLNSLLVVLCKSLKDICMDILAAGSGPGPGYINKTILPAVLQYSPSGFASKQAWHYAQVIISGEFKQYDYGKKRNRKVYNSTKPPMYDLTQVKVPTALFYAVEDPFSNPKMVQELRKSLPNVPLSYEVPLDGWNHLDYIFASCVKEQINDRLYEVFKQYEDKT